MKKNIKEKYGREDEAPGVYFNLWRKKSEITQCSNCGMDVRGVMCWFPSETIVFPLLQCLQTGSGNNWDSYRISIAKGGGRFCWGKAVWELSRRLKPFTAEVEYECSYSTSTNYSFMAWTETTWLLNKTSPIPWLTSSRITSFCIYVICPRPSKLCQAQKFILYEAESV